METDHEDRSSRIPDWLAALLLVEAGAVAIGLLMPITPSRTGSTWSLANVFFVDPTYFEKAVVWFVTANLLIGVLGLVAWVVIKRDQSG